MTYAVPKNIVKASKLLCVKIIFAVGGQSAIAQNLNNTKIRGKKNITRQHVQKWVNNGYIPDTQLYDMAKLLKVTQWALAYHKLMEVFGEESPDFKTILNGISLERGDREQILRALGQ